MPKNKANDIKKEISKQPDKKLFLSDFLRLTIFSILGSILNQYLSSASNFTFFD